MRLLAGLAGAVFGPRQVWLTFDDGPDPVKTDIILDCLATRNIRALFFVIGKQALAYPDVVARILALGHRIGSHSYSHVDLTTLTEAAIEADVRRAEQVLGAALGVKKVFRPPHGRHDGRVRRVLDALGHEMVLWDTDTRDWDHEYWPDRWVSHSVRQIRSKRRTVVLAHDPQPNTATYFEALLTQLADSGPIAYQDPFTL